MPRLQSVDELADEIADLCGVYGGHDDDNDNCAAMNRPCRMCRVCFTSVLSDRVRAAVENDRMLATAKGGAR